MLILVTVAEMAQLTEVKRELSPYFKQISLCSTNNRHNSLKQK